MRGKQMLRNSIREWGTVAKVLHWLMLALIVVQVSLGWTAELWRVSPMKLNLFVWHKSIGILLLCLAIVRIGWRLFNSPPRSPSGLPGWERMAGIASHATLYILIVAIPMTGWIINSAANIPLNVFWLFPLPDITAPSKSLADLAARIHFGLIIVLSLVLCLHVGAVLRHHFILRNDVLVRMMPGNRP